jgi:arylformamidase
MQAFFQIGERRVAADLSTGIDVGIALRSGADNPNCFWAPMPEFAPVRMGDFVGSTAKGGVVNFFNVRLNPHGNGTHTECVGHIAREPYVLPTCLRQAHFAARLLSVYPTRRDDGDRVVERSSIEPFLKKNEVQALLLRTLPNGDHKLRQTWSGTNPPYLAPDLIECLVECGIEHLLVDLPSVDREEDGGQLLGHKAFWCYPSERVRTHCTITELIFVPDAVPDGDYLLNLQTTLLDLDASPSRPVIYPIREVF